MRSFKEWTLATLDDTFALEQISTIPAFEQWLNREADISDFEREALITFQEQLRLNVHDWNERELAYNFIGPLIALVKYTTKAFNFFAERMFSGTVDDIEIGGRPDGMIASGFRQPKIPYFCFQEYKKETDPEGDPAAQALAAMLVAQELNAHNAPVYGCYVKGSLWYFMVLQDRSYCISEPYVATRDDVFDIFRILKVLKQIIIDTI
ncbi:MAG: hypothetical protein GY795_47795 [Desulfobacterales bacterium]|nr:hypothetical protein [Desulfobacterales bacterium]